ncbi:MAG TPA: alpha/beta hydrolase [Terriglobales bacterium]|nr:alpha/beta hydrolase [Terriglobales bacterium]
MLRVGAILTAAVLVSALLGSVLAAQTNEILLWPNGTPGALGQRPEDKPTLRPYLSVTKPTGAAVIVCPGGGYSHLAPHEGEPIAQWLNSIGIKSFVLKYRLGSSGYRHPAMLQDVQRAVRYVRAQANEFAIDPSRIGIIGFSAGGHIASSAGTHFLPGDSKAADPLERVSSRPDLMMLIYPVITMGKFAHVGSRDNLLGKPPAPEFIELMSNEKQVNGQTPPTFLVHTLNDATVPVENSLLFADALRAAGVGFELHVFDNGPSHGYGLAVGDPAVGLWPKLCEIWLKKHGF